jgi:hypothetical protein
MQKFHSYATLRPLFPVLSAALRTGATLLPSTHEARSRDRIIRDTSDGRGRQTGGPVDGRRDSREAPDLVRHRAVAVVAVVLNPTHVHRAV